MLRCSCSAAGFVVLSLLAASSTAARADIILEQYEFQGQLGSQASQAASLVATGLTGVAFGEGAGLTPLATANSMNSTGWTNANAYYSFGFAVNAGQVATVDQIVMGTRASATGPGTLNLQVSTDGGTYQTVASFTQSGTNYNDEMLGFAAVTATQSMVFRIVAAGTTSAGGGTTGSGGSLRVVDYAPSGSTTNTPFTIDGTLAPAASAAVPEPSALILTSLGLAAAGLLTRARRQS